MFKFKQSLVAFAGLSFLISLMAAVRPVAAQEPPDLQIVKHSWSKERLDWEKNPFGATVEGFRDMLRRVSTERRIVSALQEREASEEKAEKARPPAPLRYAFNYKLTVYNVGRKAIREIDWDFVFTDAATGEELGRREFTSVEKVGPGKRKELSLFVSSPPTLRISANTLGKRERDGLREEVVILRVLYEDGSAWQAR